MQSNSYRSQWKEAPAHEENRIYKRCFWINKFMTDALHKFEYKYKK